MGYLSLSHSSCDELSAAAKSLQLCPTQCDPIDGSPPGSPVPGILQARTLEWAAISFPNAWTWKVKLKTLSHVRLFSIPRTAAHQAPPSMGLSRQEYWSGVPLRSPDYLSSLILTHFAMIKTIWITLWLTLNTSDDLGIRGDNNSGWHRLNSHYELSALCVLTNTILWCRYREGNWGQGVIIWTMATACARTSTS